MSRRIMTCALCVAAAWLSTGCASQRLTRTGYAGIREFSEDTYREDTDFTLESLIGSRALFDDSRWEPLDRQLDIGIALQAPVVEAEENLPLVLSALRWDFSIRYAADESSRGTYKIESQTVELTAGALIEPTDPRLRFRPYVGGGLSLAFTDIDERVNDTIFSENDTVTSAYVRGGLKVLISPTQHVGVDVRYLSDGDGVDGIGGSLESTTVSLTFGARF